ncbi:MAG: hypothetical protein U0166_04065 [Acidobacteriota bacterium]
MKCARACAILVLALAASPASAGTTLSIRVLEDGTLIAYLQIDRRDLLPHEVAALAAAFPCPPPTTGASMGYLSVKCPGYLASQGRATGGSLDLAPLCRALAAQGDRVLAVEVDMPDLGFPRTSLGPVPSRGRHFRAPFSSSVHLSRDISLEEALPAGVSPLEIEFGYPAFYLPAVLLLAALLVAAMALGASRLGRRPILDPLLALPMWLTPMLFAGWVVLLELLRIDGFLTRAGPPDRLYLLATMLLLSGPPAIATCLASRLLNRRIAAKLGRPELAHRDWRAPVLTLGLGTVLAAAVDVLETDETLVPLVAAATVIWIATQIGIASTPRRDRIPERVVEPGPLRERVASWAEALDIGVGDVTLIDDRDPRRRRAGFGRLLLPAAVCRMPEREVDALLARELARLGKPERTRVRLIVLAAAFAFVASPPIVLVTGSMAAELVFRISFTLSFAAVASLLLDGRRDREVLHHTEDAEALVAVSGSIAGVGPFLLARAMRRARLIARDHAISLEVAEALAVRGIDAAPLLAEPPGPATLYSATFRRSLMAAYASSLFAMRLLVPIPFARAAATCASVGAPVVGWLLVLASLPATLLAGGQVLRFLSRRMIALRQDLHAKLVARGVPADAAVFVGMSPGGLPRLHDGFFDWDVGFLIIEPAAIAYVSDRCAFRIERPQVVAVRMGPRMPVRGRLRRVCVDWRQGDSAGTVSFQSSTASPTQRQLCERIARLLEHPGPPAGNLEAPRIPKATGVHPADAITGARVLSSLVPQAMLGAFAAWLADLPWNPTIPGSALTVPAASAVLSIWALVPLLRYRDPETNGREGAGRASSV